MKTKRGIWRTVQVVLFFVLIYTTTVSGQDKSSEKQFGWIKIETNLDSVYVVVDRQFQNARLITSSGRTDSIRAEEGAHTVTLSWRTIHDFSKVVDVFTGETYTLRHEIHNPPQYPKSSYQVIKQQYNMEISSAENTEIYVNGEFAGREKARVLQLYNNPLVKITHPERGTIEYTAKVSMIETTTVARYYSDNNYRSWYYYSVPFWKQGYHSEYGKMTFMGLSYIALSALTYTYELEIRQKHENYRKVKIAYLNAPTVRDAERQKITLDLKHKNLTHAISKQNLVIGGLVAIYVIGVIDAVFLRPREGYRGTDKYMEDSRNVGLIPGISVGGHYGMEIGLTWKL